MTTIEINEKEYELKLTYKSVERLNKAFNGGSYELIAKAMAGDVEAFPIILHAALIHTGENFTQKSINELVEELFEKEELTLDSIVEISNAVVTESFFYKPTVAKLLKSNPEMKAALDQLKG